MYTTAYNFIKKLMYLPIPSKSFYKAVRGSYRMSNTFYKNILVSV